MVCSPPKVTSPSVSIYSTPFTRIILPQPVAPITTTLLSASVGSYVNNNKTVQLQHYSQRAIVNAQGFFKSLLAFKSSAVPWTKADDMTGPDNQGTWIRADMHRLGHLWVRSTTDLNPQIKSLASRLDTGELYVNISWWNIKLFMIKMKTLQLSNENKIDYLQRNEVKITAFSSAILDPRSLKQCFQRPEKELL